VFTDQLQAAVTSASHYQLQGNITVTRDGVPLSGTLAGSIVRDEPAEPPPSDGTDPGSGDAGGEPSPEGGEAAPADPAVHTFHSDLRLTLEDGSSYVMILTGSLRDGPEGEWVLEQTGFQLRDRCDLPVGDGEVGGVFRIEEMPIYSSLELHFDGVEQTESDCTA
jgi:hypothetical protein